MEFDAPQSRRVAEPFVPMINVVFLLLIFFLMTAQITPPEPFDLTPPKAEEGAPPQAETVLHLSAAGEFGFEEQRGDAAIAAAISVMRTGHDDDREAGLRLRVDASAQAAALAAATKELARAGVTWLEIVTTRR